MRLLSVPPKKPYKTIPHPSQTREGPLLQISIQVWSLTCNSVVRDVKMSGQALAQSRWVFGPGLDGRVRVYEVQAVCVGVGVGGCRGGGAAMPGLKVD